MIASRDEKEQDLDTICVADAVLWNNEFKLDIIDNHEECTRSTRIPLNIMETERVWMRYWLMKSLQRK